MSESRTPKRSRWYRFRPIDVGDVAIETFAAFLGVLLALSVDNWRNQHNGRQKLETARHAIREELQENRRRIEENLPYLHTVELNGIAVILGRMAPRPMTAKKGEDEALNDLLTAAAKSSLRNVCESIPGRDGRGTPVVTRAAYDGAQVAGVFSSMEYGESRMIAAAYAAQDDLEHFGERAGADFTRRLFDTNDLFICVAEARAIKDRTKVAIEAYDAYLGSAPASP